MPDFFIQVLENSAGIASSGAESGLNNITEAVTTSAPVTQAIVHNTSNSGVYVSWWSSYPLLITFLIVLLVTAVLLFAAIITLIILENKNHKMQVQMLMAELAKAYEKGGAPGTDETEDSAESSDTDTPPKTE